MISSWVRADLYSSAARVQGDFLAKESAVAQTGNLWDRDLGNHADDRQFHDRTELADGANASLEELDHEPGESSQAAAENQCEPQNGRDPGPARLDFGRADRLRGHTAVIAHELGLLELRGDRVEKGALAIEIGPKVGFDQEGDFGVVALGNVGFQPLLDLGPHRFDAFETAFERLDQDVRLAPSLAESQIGRRISFQVANLPVEVANARILVTAFLLQSSAFTTKIRKLLGPGFLGPLPQERLAHTQDHQVDFGLANGVVFLMIAKSSLEGRLPLVPELADLVFEFRNRALVKGHRGVRRASRHAFRMIVARARLIEVGNAAGDIGVGVKRVDHLTFVDWSFACHRGLLQAQVLEHLFCAAPLKFNGRQLIGDLLITSMIKDEITRLIRDAVAGLCGRRARVGSAGAGKLIESRIDDARSDTFLGELASELDLSAKLKGAGQGRAGGLVPLIESPGQKAATLDAAGEPRVPLAKLEIRVLELLELLAQLVACLADQGDHVTCILLEVLFQEPVVAGDTRLHDLVRVVLGVRLVFQVDDFASAGRLLNLEVIDDGVDRKVAELREVESPADDDGAADEQQMRGKRVRLRRQVAERIGPAHVDRSFALLDDQ